IVLPPGAERHATPDLSGTTRVAETSRNWHDGVSEFHPIGQPPHLVRARSPEQVQSLRPRASFNAADPIEVARVGAIGKAPKAGRFDVVGQLTPAPQTVAAVAIHAGWQ